MASSLYYYGYKGGDTPIISSKVLEEQRQGEKDKEQDEILQKIHDDNTLQQGEIDRNSLINAEQVAQINDLYYKIEHIPSGSGGTMTDLDMGDW